MMTASKAYQLLKAEGYITTGRRDGAVVRLPAGAPDPRTLEGLRLRLCERAPIEAAWLHLLCIIYYNADDANCQSFFLKEMMQKSYRDDGR